MIDLKRRIFFVLNAGGKERIRASNTSTLSMADISEEMSSAERVVGVHFFYPAHIVPLVEIHGGSRSAEETIQTTAPAGAFSKNSWILTN